MKVESIENGVHVHTKISKKYKKAIEQLHADTVVNENVLFNTALARGLKTMVAGKTKKAAR